MTRQDIQDSIKGRRKLFGRAAALSIRIQGGVSYSPNSRDCMALKWKRRENGHILLTSAIHGDALTFRIPIYDVSTSGGRVEFIEEIKNYILGK